MEVHPHLLCVPEKSYYGLGGHCIPLFLAQNSPEIRYKFVQNLWANHGILPQPTYSYRVILPHRLVQKYREYAPDHETYIKMV